MAHGERRGVGLARMSTPISGGISGGAHARHRLLPCAIALALVVTLAWGDAARPAAVLDERGPASVVDHDGDGVCDGEDILAAARAYVATNPRYEGAYVQGGAPAGRQRGLHGPGRPGPSGRGL